MMTWRSGGDVDQFNDHPIIRLMINVVVLVMVKP